MANEGYCVYCHTNKINGKRYIGITCQTTNERWGKGGKKYKSQKFKRAITKYGWDNFSHEVLLSNLSADEAKAKEKELIKKYNTSGKNGYNSTLGGDGIAGFKFSEESKAKMSESAKARKDSRAKSDSYKKEKSEYCKLKKQTVSNKPPIRVRDNNGNEYENILEASKALGINYYTLWNQIKGRRTNKSGVSIV